MLPTPVPPSPSELATPKVLFKGRLVSGKKSNSPYFVHQRHKSRRIQEEEQSSIQSDSNSKKHPNPADIQPEPDDLHHPSFKTSSTQTIKPSSSAILQSFFSISSQALRFSLFILILSILLSRMITEDWFWGHHPKFFRWSYYFPPPQETFTIESLSFHDGIKDPTKPILLSIDGIVYNVNSNLNMYGPKATYHHFVGRDASRAFVTGCFKTGLTYDLRGLNDRQKKSLDYWINFFENSPRYPRVGRLILPKIDDRTPIPEDCDPKIEGGAI